MPLPRSSRPLPRAALVALLVTAAFSAGLVFSPPLQAGRFNPYQKLGIFSKVLSYIETHYVEDIAETELMYGAARGLTDVLDPHSRFMDPDEYGKLKKETEGNEEIEGIGIDVEKRKNRLVIVSPIEGSPAAKAGIEPGDVIKRVDGAEVNALEFDDAVSRMQGPAGSEVTLVIDRRGRELTFRVRRARYELKPVEGKMIEEGIAYLKIRVFSSTTDAILGELLDQLNAKAKGLRGVVLDLRRNPGGLLDQGVRVADRFIADGLIVKTVGKGGRVMDEAKAHSRGTWMGFPMMVIVDGATASAAEIVAGALQDHGRAVVLGTPTFGKGSVQTVIDLDGCGGKPCGLKITVARYYTPSGRSILGQGIMPNVLVDATAPPVDPGENDMPRERDLRKRLRNEQGDKVSEQRRLDDYQLQMALDYLRSWSVFAKQLGRKWRPARFGQTLTNAAFARKTSSSGEVLFKKPGRMRWNYEKPEPKLYVADGATLWLYEPEDKQAFKQDLKSSQLPAALAFLTGQGKLTTEFEVTFAKGTPYGSPGDYVLSLSPRQPQAHVKGMVFVVDPATFNVRESVITDAQGNTNDLLFSDIRINAGVPDATFRWTPPAGIRVIDTAKLGK